MQAYKAIRDALIARYRCDVKRWLGLADARSAVAGGDFSAASGANALAGDANAVQRVWTFLDAWGLTNHEAPPGTAAPAQPDFEITTTGAGRSPR